jgi:hypothetical protein
MQSRLSKPMSNRRASKLNPQNLKENRAHNKWNYECECCCIFLVQFSKIVLTGRHLIMAIDHGGFLKLLKPAK